jgi:dsDNA-binding SOS-regulon protein
MSESNQSHPLGHPTGLGLGEARVETLSERLNKSPKKMSAEDRRQIIIALRAQADKFRAAIESGAKPTRAKKVKEEIAEIGAKLQADDLDLGL